MGVILYKWIQAKSYRPGRTQPIQTIILHSTDGREAGDVETLTKGNVSVHWYVTKDGRYYHFVDDSDTAYHAGVVTSTKYSNAATVGIEQEHIDGEEPWPDAQIKATANLVAALRQKHGDLPAKSHAEVASPPGRKQDPRDYRWQLLSSLVHDAIQETWTFQQE